MVDKRFDIKYLLTMMLYFISFKGLISIIVMLHNPQSILTNEVVE